MMGDIYQHPVFFECHKPLEQLKKVEKYFKIQRRSGGGDCGPLETVADNVYCITFRCEKDQQEVLKRCKHNVELADGHLEFTVWASLEAPTPSNSTTPTAPEEDPQSIPASTASSSGEDCELQPNHQPSTSLKESPSAEEDQQKELTSECSSAQLHPDEERADSGAVGEISKVETEIDTLDVSMFHAVPEAPGSRVCVEIVQGTIETQQVDAVVSPMVLHNPLSTRIGNILNELVGPQLTSKFLAEEGEKSFPGDSVLVEGLPGLPSDAVFFLNLCRWDDDENGLAVQVLRLGINNILTSCERRGFGSVAFPVLGSGIALRIPDIMVARVLLEEVNRFEQNRASSSPLLVRIVIHPDDDEAHEVFTCIQKALKCKDFVDNSQQHDQDKADLRVVLLGKTGAGKSSFAEAIFEEKVFEMNDSANSGTRECQSATREVNGRNITVIDTPGFFDNRKNVDNLKAEIAKCITECSPGPHAFLIFLKVEKFTEHEKQIISKIKETFSEEALKYAVVVFTHGDQLRDGMTIGEFVSGNEDLQDLLGKCGGRCHVVDNKYWKNNQQDEYRNNQIQVGNLLNTITEMVNNRGFYTNEMLQTVNGLIQEEERRIQSSSGYMSQEDRKSQAKKTVFNSLKIGTTGTLLGALFGAPVMVGAGLLLLQSLKN